MKIAHHFRSPFVRIPFLVFSVIATVATSQPAWGLSEQAIAENVYLEPGASTERKVEYTGSEEVTVTSLLKGGSPVGTKLRIEISDSNTPADTTDAGIVVDASSNDGASPPSSNNSQAPSSSTSSSKNCTGKRTFEVRAPNRWYLVTEDRPSDPEVYSADLTTRQDCDQKSGTTTLKIVNVGEVPTSLYWTVTASIGGDGDEPDGAFVKAKVVP